MSDWAPRLWNLLSEELFDEPSTDDLFNMYHDHVDSRDVADAVQIRRNNLRNYVRSYPAKPEVLLVIEAPGPWGCRFSGVPITSEAQLLDPDFPIDGERSSSGGEPRNEYSANIFWGILKPAFPRFFIWNTVPFHPHHAGRPDTIRGPRVTEIRRFAEMNRAVVDILQPSEVFAVGRKAERLLQKEIGVEARYVRHPSQGGATAFAESIRHAFGLR